MRTLLTIPPNQRRFISKNMWSSNMRQEVATKASKAMECVMAEESSTIRMEDTTRAIGETTRWMDSAGSTMKVVSWPTKAIGHRMSSMAKARSTTIILSISRASSTTPTSISSKTTGSTTKACSFMIPSRDAAESNYRTAKCSRETSTTTVSKALVSSILSKARSYRAFGGSLS
jgi:hypothetical protein